MLMHNTNMAVPITTNNNTFSSPQTNASTTSNVNNHNYNDEDDIKMNIFVNTTSDNVSPTIPKIVSFDDHKCNQTTKTIFT